MAKKKTYQFDLSIRLLAEAESVDAAFEAALGHLDPDYVQIRSEVVYREKGRDVARIPEGSEPEQGIITKEDIGVADGLDSLLDAIFGTEKPSFPSEPSPEQLLKDTMGEDN